MSQNLSLSTGPVVVLRADGARFEHNTMGDALRFLRRRGYIVANTLPVDGGLFGPRVWDQGMQMAHVVLIDDIGLRVSPETAQALAAQLEPHVPWVPARWRRHEGVPFRQAPIPGTGKRSWRSCYRHPRTLAENRAQEALLCDLRDNDIEVTVKIRKKRVKLPTLWDDVHRSDGYDRNWKRHRKTQYKT